ncbi:MAG TPA: hypothetical protein VE988_25685 [Gemmataceae bacterium]|nr:hypothetical protein [Gemmataceae bacterium]
MKKICVALAAGLWIALSGNFAAAQLPPKTYPVTAQVSAPDTSAPPKVFYVVPASATSNGTACTNCVATHAPCDCKPMCYSNCSATCVGCSAPCGCQESCFSKLCRWLCYKPLPVPCDCLGHCNHCAPCVPPLYSLFMRPGGNCMPCGNCTYATSCSFCR